MIATGGWSHLLAGESETIQEIDEFLTLDGVRLVHAHNSHPKPRRRARGSS